MHYDATPNGLHSNGFVTILEQQQQRAADVGRIYTSSTLPKANRECAFMNEARTFQVIFVRQQRAIDGEWAGKRDRESEWREKRSAVRKRKGTSGS